MSNAGSRGQLQDDVGRLRSEVAELRRSRKRLVQAAVADRRVLERALHDGVQQYLVALAIDLQRLTQLVPTNPDAAQALLAEMAANVQQALTEATELAGKVYPRLLERRGFATALRAAAERAGVTALVDVPERAEYPPEIIDAVYWSCIEALSSASPGSQVTVSVRDAVGEVSLEVGLPGPPAEQRLDRLRDRIEAFDGRVSVVEGQGGGSLVQGWLPLSP